MNSETIVPMLLVWFEKNARDLPWRRTSNPYAIWVSEIMLQQTQVKTVVRYWGRWMKALPTLAALAEAQPQHVHKLWEGLGYYTRVRNLQQAARLVVTEHGGKFPKEFEQVLQLPGIGRYTAGAICSIAFDQACPILDGNVIRVLTRLFGIDGDPKGKKVNAKLWDLARSLVEAADEIGRGAIADAGKPGRKFRHGFCSQLNQSLMELGALVCTPRQPNCEACPLRQWCRARKQGRTEELPALATRARTTKRRFVAFVAARNGKFLVRQRPAGVVNSLLWEFPNIEVENHDGEPGVAARKTFGIAPTGLKELCTIHHSITRYRIRMDVYQFAAGKARGVQCEGGNWLAPEDLRRLPFASAHKQVLDGFL
ncbi:MAG TPA: A/G-specific adenine glycosylase [Patescibacteria group bacterium]|nr:A/G-specific adenine glycosylase [Patescibacteria group bacterium]